MTATNRIADTIIDQARNPATLRKLMTEAALCRSDLEHRGYKIPKQPDLGHQLPRMMVGGREFATFVVCRGEDYIDGKISLWSMVRTLCPGVVADILEYVDLRNNKRLPPPDFGKEVLA